jgi:HPt (histidine-containing phosphotransfer) domain-containing protein
MRPQAIINDHFKPETLSSFVNGKEKLMLSTLKALKEGLDQDAQLIGKVFQERDQAQLRSLAHKIKPNFFLLGMNEVGNLCKELESVNFDMEGNEKVHLLLDKIPNVIKEIDEFTIGHLYHEL